MRLVAVTLLSYGAGRLAADIDWAQIRNLAITAAFFFLIALVLLIIFAEPSKGGP